MPHHINLRFVFVLNYLIWTTCRVDLWSHWCRSFGLKGSVSVPTRAYCYKLQTANSNMTVGPHENKSLCWSVGLTACWLVASTMANMPP